MNTPESMDPLFREQLQQLDQVAPTGWDPEGAWEKLTPELPSSSFQRMVPLYWIAASAACLALLLVLTWGKWTDNTPTSSAQQEVPMAPQIQDNPQPQVPATPTESNRSMDLAVRPDSQCNMLPQKVQPPKKRLAPIERIVVNHALPPIQYEFPQTVSLRPTPSLAQAERLPVVRFEEGASPTLGNRPPSLNHPLNLNVIRLKPVAPNSSQQSQIAVKIPFSPTP